MSFNEPVRDFGSRIQEATISLNRPGLLQRVGASLVNADAGWYASIAANGYERQPFEATREHTWAFFPLFPLLLGLFGRITGEYALTGSLLSSLFLLLALVQLYRLVLEYGYETDTAQRAVLYLAAFPTSYFFSLPLTESLFLLLSVSCFLAARKDAWWLAGFCGGLAASTRVTGLCLFPALVLLYWQRFRSINVNVLSLFLIPAGVALYMIFLYRVTGNAFAFLDVQVAWGHSLGFFLRPLWEYLKNPFEISLGWDFRYLNFLAALLGFICGGVFLKRKQWALATYTLLCLILPLSAMHLQSLTRYTMIIFPIFILLAEVGKSQRIDQLIRTLFVFGLGVMTLLFAMHFSLAMS